MSKPLVSDEEYTAVMCEVYRRYHVHDQPLDPRQPIVDLVALVRKRLAERLRAEAEKSVDERYTASEDVTGLQRAARIVESDNE